MLQNTTQALGLNCVGYCEWSHDLQVSQDRQFLQWPLAPKVWGATFLTFPKAYSEYELS